MIIIKFSFNLFLIFFITSCSSYNGNFKIKNTSNKTISFLSVNISDKEFIFKNILPNESVSSEFKIISDDRYIITVEFNSGNSIRKELGYITNGFNIKHIIIINSNNIEIINTEFVN